MGTTLDMPLRRHGYVVPTPTKRLALLAGGFVAGRRLIPLLKRRLIFRRAANGARFSRTVRVVGDETWIADAFHGKTARAAPSRGRLLPPARELERRICVRGALPEAYASPPALLGMTRIRSGLAPLRPFPGGGVAPTL